MSLTPSQIGAAGPTTVQIDVVFPVGGLLGASASLNGLDVLQLLLPFVTEVTSTSARDEAAGLLPGRWWQTRPHKLKRGHGAQEKKRLWLFGNSLVWTFIGKILRRIERR